MKSIMLTIVGIFLLLNTICVSQRVLVRLDTLTTFQKSLYDIYWVDTLGAGFSNTHIPDIPEMTERLHTRLPQVFRIYKNALDLSVLPTIGDTMRRTMFKPEYRVWCDSLQSIVNDFGGGVIVLEHYTNQNSGNNVSHWKIHFIDTVRLSFVESRIDSLFPDSMSNHLGPIIMIPSTPFAYLNSLHTEQENRTCIVTHYTVSGGYTIKISAEEINHLRNQSVEIYSLTGMKLWCSSNDSATIINNQNHVLIQLPSLSSGVYLIRYGQYSSLLCLN